MRVVSWWMVVALLAACGDDEEPGPVDDLPRVEVQRGSAVETTVLFLSAEGAVLERVQTSEARLSGPITPGGSVMTVSPDLVSVRWVLDVQPGDVVDLTGGPQPDGDVVPEPATATFRLPPLPEERASVALQASCGWNGPSRYGTVSLGDGVYGLDVCQRSFDFLATVSTSDGDVVLFVPGVSHAGATATVIEGDYVSPERLVVASPGMAPTHALFMATPAGIPSVYLEDEGLVATAGEGLLPWLPALGGQGLVMLREQGEGRLRTVARRFTEVGSADLALPEPLPAVTDVRADGDQVSWTAAESSADVVQITMRSQLINTLIIVAPPGTRAVSRPELPSDLAAAWPDELDRVDVMLVDDESVGSWAEARQAPMLRW
jgi:hypothetical protein